MQPAWQRAKQQWETANPGQSFDGLLTTYVAHGCVVWSCADEFLLACPVRLDEGRLVHDPELADTWFIHLAAVSDANPKTPSQLLSTFTRLAPRPLPFVAWHRRQSKRLHRHTWEQVQAIIHRSTPSLHEHHRRSTTPA